MEINPIQYDMLVVTGITATGKTGIAAQMAKELSGEIISADSRQVFKGMTIGTGKDLADYVVDGEQIPFHLIDIKNPGETYSVFNFQNDFHEAYNSIRNNNHFPILSGGTGLYVESVLKQYKLLDVPQNKELRDELKQKSLEELTEILAGLKHMHNTTDVDTKLRAIRAIEIETFHKENQIEQTSLPSIKSLVVAPHFERKIIRERITQRLQERLAEGMVEETKALLDSGVNPDKLISYGLEYKFLTWYLIGKMDYETMVERLNIAIHQFAKRQMTWFRRMERKGININWIDGNLPMNEKVSKIKELLFK
ncbi:MAG: tRNA (adenosine(37)-N6)-dimethylallyltransferase MiaA [Salinivirgaceae bacterium]|nr:MAG: tRNA (adenosine(37)-N6)-dimethylallyltransferase MiaA [Salinivirgaceae bacterium]